ncbi:MAG: AraC family transcriptional regulator ligand-binding domain-containing protein [Cellvibrionaceae bacterium]
MQPQINRSFIHGFDQMLLEKGVQPAIFYQQAKISPSYLNQDSGPIPFYNELRLFEMAAKYFSEPDICVKLAERQSLSALGPAASNLQANANVHEALLSLQENLHLSVEAVRLELSTSENIAVWQVNWVESIIGNSAYAQDHALALMCIIMKALCGEHWKPRAVYLEHTELTNLNSFHRFFGAPIAFDNSFTGLAFDPKCLKLPTRLNTQAEPKDQTQLPSKIAQPTLTQQIKNVISLLIDNDDCCIEKVAEHLCMSKRTVQRRLQEDGTNFKDLVNSVRREQAVQLLKNAHYSLAEVGAMLGYSQLSAFSRSFKRWYGVSPQIWRQKNALKK